MLTEQGRVVALDGSAVWVETLRQSSCGACAARAGCGHGLMNSAGSRPQVVQARLGPDSPEGLAVHDRVSISLPEQGFLRGATLLYGLPLVTTLLGATVASSFGADTVAAADTAGAVGAALGLSVGLLWLRRWSRRIEARPGQLPVVAARL